MKVEITEAISLLKKGEVVALPTETVYGLAAPLELSKSIKKIFEIKKRPLNNPLIIHVSSIATIRSFLLEAPPFFEELGEKFWPGPLTLILPVDTDKIPSLVRSNLPTAAFRIPAHPKALEIIKEVGPLVMPSANLSGKPSSTLLEHIEKDFGSDFPVVDGGACLEGLESTVLYFLDPTWVILRQGAIPSEQFETILGYCPTFETISRSNKQPLSPGQILRHYAPDTPLSLGEVSKFKNAPLILGFRERSYLPHHPVIYLGSLMNPKEVASHLYQILREIDTKKVTFAWVDMDFPETGLWKSIRDRLIRASEE